MKKRSKVLAVLLCLAMALSVGCGSEKVEEKTDKADLAPQESADEPQEEEEEPDEKLVWIQEASAQYNASKVRGNVKETVYTKQDGSTYTQKYVTTFDTDRQVIMEQYFSEDNAYTNFYTKEGDSEYMYTQGYNTDPNTGEMTEIPVKVSVNREIDSYGSYSAMIDNENTELFESNDRVEYTDVKVTEEGEEEIDGTAVVKLKVDYTKKAVGEEKISRESVLGQYKWTEEDVALLDGMSDAVDAYVEESNLAVEDRMNNAKSSTDIYYLSAEDHSLVRFTTEGETEGISASVKTFWNMSSKLDWLKDLVAGGMGTEEAKSYVNENFITDDSAKAAESYTSVTTYVTGDSCEQIAELPADARMITLEQYENGEY